MDVAGYPRERITVFSRDPKKLILSALLLVICAAIVASNEFSGDFSIYVLLIIVEVGVVGILAADGIGILESLFVFTGTSIAYYYPLCSTSTLGASHQIAPFPEVLMYCPVQGAAPPATYAIIGMGLATGIILGTATYFVGRKFRSFDL